MNVSFTSAVDYCSVQILALSHKLSLAGLPTEPHLLLHALDNHAVPDDLGYTAHRLIRFAYCIRRLHPGYYDMSALVKAKSVQRVQYLDIFGKPLHIGMYYANGYVGLNSKLYDRMYYSGIYDLPVFSHLNDRLNTVPIKVYYSGKGFVYYGFADTDKVKARIIR